MSNINNASSSESEFTDISTGAMPRTGSNFTMVDNHTPTNSDYEVVSNADNWSEVTNEQEDASTRVDTENMSLKEIDEVAGGSIKRYMELIMESMKQRTGMPFTAEVAVPAPGELVGDKKPGYEKMALGAKFWAWWTKKELAIFEAQILKELKAKDAESKQRA